MPQKGILGQGDQIKLGKNSQTKSKIAKNVKNSQKIGEKAQKTFLLTVPKNSHLAI